MTDDEMREMEQRALDMKHVLSGCVAGDGKPAFENSQSEHVLALLSELRLARERERKWREAATDMAHALGAHCLDRELAIAKGGPEGQFSCFAETPTELCPTCEALAVFNRAALGLKDGG